MLARIEGRDAYGKRIQPLVGKYTVKVKEFETYALPSISKKTEEKHVVVIDEVGKMEMFSPTFIKNVRSVIQSGNSTVFATIPAARGRPIQLVEEIRNNKDFRVFEITHENRDVIKEDILQTLLQLCT